LFVNNINYARVLGPDNCQDLPSVVIEGAITISALCISRMVEAPQKPIAVLIAPTKFWVPLVTEVGTKENLLQRNRGADFDAGYARQGRDWGDIPQ